MTDIELLRRELEIAETALRKTQLAKQRLSDRLRKMRQRRDHWRRVAIQRGGWVTKDE